jgi:hypothetical protein
VFDAVLFFPGVLENMNVRHEELYDGGRFLEI